MGLGEHCSNIHARYRAHPIRGNQKFLAMLHRIVRLERNLKQVLAVHTFVHHNIHVNRSRLTGLECRLTDDDFGRSASFKHICHAVAC